MARVTIDDLDEGKEISTDELKAVFGGTGNNPFLNERSGAFTGNNPFLNPSHTGDVPDGTEFGPKAGDSEGTTNTPPGIFPGGAKNY